MASKGGLNLLAVGESLLKEYQKTSTTQTKVIDAYLLYVLATALIQVRTKSVLMIHDAKTGDRRLTTRGGVRRWCTAPWWGPSPSTPSWPASSAVSVSSH